MKSLIHNKGLLKDMKYLTNSIILLVTIIIVTGCTGQKNIRFVLMPDIQTYTRLYPEILECQTRWIKEHADSITFVLQQGDMTENNIDEQWKVAASGMNILDNQVPYAFVMGNHDLGNNSDKRDSKLFNEYFPYIKHSQMRHFGGAFEEGKMDNVWYSF